MAEASPIAASQPLPSAPRTVILQAALGLMAAVFSGLMLSLLWQHLGLPDRPSEGGIMAAAAKPWGLKAFVCFAGPAAVATPSLVLAALALLLPGRGQPGPAALAGRLLRLDALTYLGCPALFALVFIWRELGNGFAALGLVFLGMVTLKSILLLRLLWQGYLSAEARAAEPAGQAWRRRLAVFLAAWTILGLLAVWNEEAISSASDEVGYLLLTHSLVSRGSFNVFPAMEKQEYLSFYWARFSPELGQSPETAQAWIFPFLTAPAYWLAGRLGVMLLFAGFMALAAWQLLAWLEEAGLKPGPAAAGTGLALASAPVLFMSQQVYPDVPVMLLFLVGLRLLLALPRRPWLAGLCLALTAALLAGLKLRLAPLGAGLILMGALELLALRWGWRRALAWTALGLSGLAVLAWALPASWWPRALSEMWSLTLFQLKRVQAWWQPLSIFFSGLALDQNFGLLLPAPLLVLSLAAWPAGLRRLPRPFVHLALPAGLYLGMVCLTRWFQWYAGFSIPGRFAAVALPAAALPLGLALGALNRPWLRLAVWLPAAWGLFYAWMGSLIPQLRFSRPQGVNPLLGAVAAALDLDLHHLLPSTFTLSPGLRAWLGGTLAALAALGWLIWRGAAKAPASPPAGWNRREPAACALIAGLVAAGFLAAASHNPPRFLEAEQMNSEGAAAWTEYAYPDMMRGMVLLDGHSLGGRMFFPGGEAKLTLTGEAKRSGQVILTIDRREFMRNWDLEDRNLTVDLGQVERGFHKLSVAWRSCPTRRCSLLLDRLELR